MSAESSGRPSMRRKSSASNLLLSSFKATTPTAPAPPAIVPPPIPREADSQSMYSETSTAYNPGQNNLEYLRSEVVHKRMVTLTYLRNIHEGKAHWLGTVYLSRPDLERVFNNNVMKKRTWRFAVLGMSLANVLDIQSGNDLLKSILGILSEYDQLQEDNYKPRMKNPFRSKMPKRSGGQEFALPVEMMDSFLTTPNMPFPLDYHQTLLSLIDVLSEVYFKLAQLLGPSQLSGGPLAPLAFGPLAHLAPQPGISYLDVPPELDVAPAAATGAARVPQSPTGAWTPALGELLLKADGKFRKILAALLKEVDEHARAQIKEELASLDPLLRNVSLRGPSEYELLLQRGDGYEPDG